ncbi:MAG: hypothetical protein KJ025_07100 [Burkholderiales bacterium]|nr:hypothetical protein [Burkholderiales bacterium]
MTRAGRPRRGPLLAAAIVLGACGHLPGPEEAAEPAPPPVSEIVVVPPRVTEVIVVPEDARQITALMDYYARVAGMAPEDQRREYGSASQAFNRERSAFNRVRLAMLAAMPGTAFQDEARALDLLEPFAAGDGGAGRVGQLGAILHAQVSERAKARGRADQFKEQLDALRAVERAIIDRGQGPPAKRQ